LLRLAIIEGKVEKGILYASLATFLVATCLAFETLKHDQTDSKKQLIYHSKVSKRNDKKS